MNLSASNIFLLGDRVYLRPLEIKDCEGDYPSWLNNRDVTRYNSHGKFPYTKNQAISFVETLQGSHTNITLAIVDKKTDKHIGNISLQNIDWITRSAELAILIGDSTFFGHGIGYEASKLITEHGFRTLNLQRIYCGTSADNKAMQHLAVKLGMSKEGTRKNGIFNNGQYVDIIEYGLLNVE